MVFNFLVFLPAYFMFRKPRAIISVAKERFCISLLSSKGCNYKVHHRSAHMLIMNTPQALRFMFYVYNFPTTPNKHCWDSLLWQRVYIVLYCIVRYCDQQFLWYIFVRRFLFPLSVSSEFEILSVAGAIIWTIQTARSQMSVGTRRLIEFQCRVHIEWWRTLISHTLTNLHGSCVEKPTFIPTSADHGDNTTYHKLCLLPWTHNRIARYKNTDAANTTQIEQKPQHSVPCV